MSKGTYLFYLFLKSSFCRQPSDGFTSGRGGRITGGRIPGGRGGFGNSLFPNVFSVSSFDLQL